jgi:hypothetical protein
MLGFSVKRAGRLSSRRLVSLLTLFVAGALAAGAYLDQSALASKGGHGRAHALGSGYGGSGYGGSGYGGSGYAFSSSRTITTGRVTVTHSLRVRKSGSGSVTNAVHAGGTGFTRTTGVPAPVTVNNSVTVAPSRP